MLQNIRENKRKTTFAKKHRRLLKREGITYDETPGFKGIFQKYLPTGNEYVKDTYTDFTGCFVDIRSFVCHPNCTINNFTNSVCNGEPLDSALCDNASQALDYYYNVFLKEKFVRPTYRAKTEEIFNKQRKGNHVIIFYPMYNFRWHKWGSYIGNFEPKCEYFSDEKDIKMVYFFEIYKVR